MASILSRPQCVKRTRMNISLNCAICRCHVFVFFFLKYTQPMLWLLMTCRRTEPGHHRPWHWPTDLVFPEYSGLSTRRINMSPGSCACCFSLTSVICTQQWRSKYFYKQKVASNGVHAVIYKYITHWVTWNFIISGSEMEIMHVRNTEDTHSREGSNW